MKTLGVIAGAVFFVMLIWRFWFFLKFALASTNEPLETKIKRGVAAAFNPYPGGAAGVA